MDSRRAFLNDVLFVLSASDSLGWGTLTRTSFQKILYLSAVLSTLDKIEWGYDFTNAPYGPFNREIHIAPDLLVHRQLAKLSSLTIQRDSKIRATYTITEKGLAEADLICQLDEERERLQWITTIMEALDIYGSPLITKLAYQEPTFSNMRKQNKGGAIDLSPDGNRSIKLLGRMTQVLKDDFAILLDTRMSCLILYFDYLSTGISQRSSR